MIGEQYKIIGIAQAEEEFVDVHWVEPSDKDIFRPKQKNPQRIFEGQLFKK